MVFYTVVEATRSFDHITSIRNSIALMQLHDYSYRDVSGVARVTVGHFMIHNNKEQVSKF